MIGINIFLADLLIWANFEREVDTGVIVRQNYFLSERTYGCASLKQNPGRQSPDCAEANPDRHRRV